MTYYDQVIGRTCFPINKCIRYCQIFDIVLTRMISFIPSMAVKCRCRGGELRGFLLHLHKSRLNHILPEKCLDYCSLNTFTNNDTRYVPQAMSGAKETHE